MAFRRFFGLLQEKFYSLSAAAGEILAFLAHLRRNVVASGPPEANLYRFCPTAGEIFSFLARRRQNFFVLSSAQPKFFVSGMPNNVTKGEICIFGAVEK